MRDSASSTTSRSSYDYACQASTPGSAPSAGPYAEGAHVQPLGNGYDGPDHIGNVLCLCLNCHVQFDQGGLLLCEDGPSPTCTAPTADDSSCTHRRAVHDPGACSASDGPRLPNQG